LKPISPSVGAASAWTTPGRAKAAAKMLPPRTAVLLSLLLLNRVPHGRTMRPSRCDSLPLHRRGSIGLELNRKLGLA
jgi:hypothetical protein